MTNSEWEAIFLSLRLAGTTTFILLVLGAPLAFFLALTKSKAKPFIEAIVALPIVLPPTVLGFYLLWFLGPQGFVGESLAQWGVSPLPFTFWGLVVGSCFYSLPFVIQPLQNSFESIGREPLDIAATLRASRFVAFFRVILPLAKSGIISAIVLGFMHTIGEFGVVLMMGGNIEGKTRVISVAIYDYVEAMEYKQAHRLALGLMLFSFVSLFILYIFRRRMDKTKWNR